MTTQLRLTINSVKHFEFNYIVELSLDMCIYQDKYKNSFKCYLHILRKIFLILLYNCIRGVQRVININVMHMT
jgi:hypothetical protein